MSHLSFHTSGGDRRQFERELARHEAMRHLSRNILTRVRAWAFSSPLATAASSLVLIAAVSSIQPPPQPIDLVTARNILIFQDISGSMANSERRMRAELEPLKSYGVDIDRPIGIAGFGVKHDGTTNFLHPLEAAVIGSKADAAYLFSDFEVVTKGWDDDDDEGFAKLRQILREHHMRLYLRSVRYRPAAQLIAIAHESGGDFIEP